MNELNAIRLENFRQLERRFEALIVVWGEAYTLDRCLLSCQECRPILGA
jgi:hypothetical protein